MAATGLDHAAATVAAGPPAAQTGTTQAATPTGSATSPAPTVPARILMLPIRAWRLFSVHLPARCRFYPSCSQYALEALTLHGAWRGSLLAVRRIGRCHPWHDGGLDPVPPTSRRTNARSHRHASHASTATAPPAVVAEET